MSNIAVLLVEPDNLQRNLMVMALNRGKIPLEVCQDLDELPGMLELKKPLVLVMDIYLPGKNGFDLIYDLKTRGLLENTKVIGISSMAFPEVVRKTVQSGFVDFLVKPLDMDLFLSRVQRAIYTK
jgi:DNA-binding NtrC family response regulator